MIDVRAASREDIYAAVQEAKDIYGSEPDLLVRSLASAQEGDVACFTDGDGHIGCIVGMVSHWRGVAAVWAVTTDHLAVYPVSYTRALRRLLENKMKDMGLHRVEMTVRRDYPTGRNWAEALGFEFEGILYKYGPDKADHVMYRRLA